MKVIIPAAGLGSRFVSQGVTIAKELLPLGPRPLIGHALHEAARAGFEAAVVVIAPSKHQLRDYLLRTTSPLPVEIVFQDKPLGTGDAVARCWDGEPVGVLLPDDVVLETQHWIDLQDIHRQSGAASLCVRPVPFETTGRFGIADCDGDRVVHLVEKPDPGTTSSNLAVFGRYVVTESVISGLEHPWADRELDLTAGMSWAVQNEPGVRAIRFKGEIFDCGTPTEYAKSMARFPETTSEPVTPRGET